LIIKKKTYIIFAVIFYLSLTLFPSVPSAHAYIVESSPSENELVKQPPKEISIQFDEPIQPKFNSIKVTDSNGKRVDKRNVKIDPNNPTVLIAGLKNNLPNDTYRIQWKVVSDDGHPVQGVIPFQIGTVAEQGGASIKTETKNYMPRADLVIIRWLQYISIACYTGLFFFYLIVMPKQLWQIHNVDKSLSKFIWLGFIVLSMSTIFSLPLQATMVLGSKWNEVFSFDALEQILAYTLFGKIWFIQIGILMTLALTTHFWNMADSTKKALSWVCLGLGMGLLLTRSFLSHAAAQENSFLTITSDFLHLLAASVWVGCLIGLALLLRLYKKNETKSFYLETVRNFSNWGILLVFLLTATGLFNAFQFIPTSAALFHTIYGKALMIKLILFFIMLIFALVNFRKGKAAKEQGLDSSIFGELAVGFMILMLTVFLTNFPTAMSSPGPFSETNSLGNGKKVTLKITPNVMGENEYYLYLKNVKNQPINDIEQITLTYTHMEMKMGKDSIILTKAGAGSYKAKGMNLNMSGKWRVHVHILTKALETNDTDFQVIVGSK
jgi:copper transport protein